MAEDLFGNTVDEAKPKRPKRITNNIEVVQRTLQRATSEQPYALVGPTGQVCRRQSKDSDHVTACAWQEADVVHQLITGKQLEVGGGHRYVLRGEAKHGQSVLVPKATRDMVNRWQQYTPLSTSNTRRKSA